MHTYSSIDDSWTRSSSIATMPHATLEDGDSNPFTEETRTHDPLISETPAVQGQNIPLKQAIKLYPKTVGYCMAVCSAVLLQGYDSLIVGAITALPAFQHKFGELYENEYIIPTQWLSLFESLGPVGSIIGNMFGGWLQDRIGRRRTLAAGSFLSIAAVIVMFLCDTSPSINGRRAIFLSSKIFQGLATGTLTTTTQTYISENVPACLRGSAMALFPTFYLLGQLTGASVITSLSSSDAPSAYRTAFASQWAFSVLPFIFSFLIPESPSYLIRKKDFPAALHNHKRLLTAKIDGRASFRDLRRSIALEEQTTEKVRYQDCFRGTNLRRTLIVVFASNIQTFFGLPLLGSASYFLQMVGMEARLSLIFLIVGIILGSVANGFSIWVQSRVGRRPLSIITLAITTVLWAGMGVAGFWSGPVTMWFTAGTMMAVIITCGCGVWSASVAVAAETSSLRLRSKTVAIGGFANNIGVMVFNFALPYIYNPDAGNLKAKTGLFYAGVCGLTTLGTWMVIPELKGRTAIEIHQMFEEKVPARRLKDWKGGVVVEEGVKLEELAPQASSSAAF